MTKKEYLNELVAGLMALSTEELRRVRDYYAEMIDDRVEAGMTEEQAVAELEPPAALAAQLLRENGVQSETALADGQLRVSGAIRALTAKLRDTDAEICVSPLPDGLTALVRFRNVDPKDFHCAVENGALVLEEAERNWRQVLRFRRTRLQLLLSAAELETLDLVSASADMRVSGLRIGEGGIRSTSGDIRLEKLECAGALTVNTTSGDAELAEVRADGLLTVTSVSGDLSLEKLHAGDLELQSQSGDCELKNASVSGDARLHTASGDIECGAVSLEGECAVETASGDAKLRRVSGGALRAGTSSGDVELHASTFARIDIATASGEVCLRETSAEGDCEVETMSGDISLDAAEAGALRLFSRSGSIQGALRGEDCYSFQAAARAGEVSVPATQGPRPVEAQTVGGDIRLETMP